MKVQVSAMSGWLTCAIQLWLMLTLADLAAYPKQDRTASASHSYRLPRPPQEKCLGIVFAVHDTLFVALTWHMQGPEEPQQDVSIVFFKIHYVEGCTVLMKPCPMLL